MHTHVENQFANNSFDNLANNATQEFARNLSSAITNELRQNPENSFKLISAMNGSADLPKGFAGADDLLSGFDLNVNGTNYDKCWVRPNIPGYHPENPGNGLKLPQIDIEINLGQGGVDVGRHGDFGRLGDFNQNNDFDLKGLLERFRQNAPGFDQRLHNLVQNIFKHEGDPLKAITSGGPVSKFVESTDKLLDNILKKPLDIKSHGEEKKEGGGGGIWKTIGSVASKIIPMFL